MAERGRSEPPLLLFSTRSLKCNSVVKTAPIALGCDTMPFFPPLLLFAAQLFYLQDIGGRDEKMTNFLKAILCVLTGVLVTLLPRGDGSRRQMADAAATGLARATSVNETAGRDVPRNDAHHQPRSTHNTAFLLFL